jgi:hypothetical protein
MIFTTLAMDPLNGANENPLNPALWSVLASGLPPLQILNHECVSTDFGQDSDIGFYVGITWPDDQWAEIKIAALSTDGLLNVDLRMADDQSIGYDLSLTDNGDGTLTATVAIQNGAVLGAFITSWTMGDVFRFAVLGTNLYVFQNGVQIGTTISDSSVASGKACLNFYAENAVTDIAATHFAGGSVAAGPNVWSQPDCRVAPFGPNASRDVQGTSIYDVQTSCNPAVPGTDSRAAGAPVDCRVSAPQNSRNNP